ncbi:TolC family protein [Filimonas effusa]|uniref:TolC family protein n=1 Tax=Filimonas effusa TaxID=2508721 RepID=A0A4Q1D9H7_9BACT|nr:TolC family protein [Filimonas effusa]RXK85355.1 TolC family protein [Filimonas effusa]
MKKKLFISFILFSGITGAAYSQVQTNTELKTLINQSFSYFPTLKEADNSIVAAEQRVQLAELKVPEVNGNASYNYIRPKITLPLEVDNKVQEFQFAPVHSGNVAINAEYALFDFGRLKRNVERAKTDVQFAKDNAAYARTQLAYQVAAIYYNIVYFQKALNIQDSVLDYLNENKRVIESKLKNGDAIKIDLLNIQANIDAEQNRSIDLRSQLRKQLNLLAYTTGSQDASGKAFDFDLALRDAASALSEAQASNLDFMLAKDRIAQATGDVEVAKLGDRPSVNLNAAAGYKNGYVPNVTELRFNYIAGVSLKVPIYNGSRTKKQVTLAETAVKQNELAIESLNNTYKKDIEQALTDISTNLSSIKNTRSQIEQTRAAQQIAASRFLNGAGTNLDITTASSNYQRALLTALQYEYHLCLAKVELARLMGYKYW